MVWSSLPPKITITGIFLWNGLSKIKFFTKIWHLFWRRPLRPHEVKKVSNGGLGINSHYSGSHWGSAFGRFVKKSGQARSLLYHNSWWLTLYLQHIHTYLWKILEIFNYVYRTKLQVSFYLDVIYKVEFHLKVQKVEIKCSIFQIKRVTFMYWAEIPTTHSFKSLYNH